MKRKIWIPIILISILLSTLSPLWVDVSGAGQDNASTATTKMIVNNKTGKLVDLTLQGAVSYNFKVKPGKETFSVNPGRYQFVDSTHKCNFDG